MYQEYLLDSKAGARAARFASVQLSAGAVNGLGTGHDAITFALGSCRYSGTAVEYERADAPFRELLRHMAAHVAPADQPAFVLFMGDQIYADATAGAFETRTRLELYVERYNRAFSSAAAARVFATLPSYMMLDDHEIQDDWDDSFAAGPRSNLSPSEVAQSAFRAFQWSHGPRSGYGTAPESDRRARGAWYHFESAGFRFFVLDTRLERDRRPGPNEADGAGVIASDTQMAALAAWLGSQRDDDRPKFIISPSAIAPISIDQGTAAYRSRGDGWFAYPASLRKLGNILAAAEARNVVFLSGDLHSSFAKRLVFQRDGDETPYSIVAHALTVSPLYAPYPFANTTPDQFHRQFSHSDTVVEGASASRNTYGFSYSHLWEGTHHGFGLLRVQKDAGGSWILSLGFAAAGKEDVRIELAVRKASTAQQTISPLAVTPQ
jgi:phosphodiesterase/alkaline phosphatase D-like protein